MDHPGRSIPQVMDLSQPTHRSLLLTGLVACLALASGCELLGDTSLPDYAEIEDISYVRHVQVLFEDRCGTCHDGSTAALDLTSREGLLSGSYQGGAVLPFDPDRSRLLQVLNAHPADVGEAPISQAEVDFLRRWIEAGARDDDGRVPYADREGDAADGEDDGEDVEQQLLLLGVGATEGVGRHVLAHQLALLSIDFSHKDQNKYPTLLSHDGHGR